MTWLIIIAAFALGAFAQKLSEPARRADAEADAWEGGHREALYEVRTGRIDTQGNLLWPAVSADPMPID